MVVALSRGNLARLDPRIAVPRYAAAELRPGIVHFGVGNFHRAHQAAFLDELFDQGLDRDWAVIGTGVRAGDAAMREDLLAQDLLTTVVEQEATSSRARVIAPMLDFIAPGDTRAILAALADPRIRIVSLTVTEGGYYVDQATQSFDADHPDIAADAADRLAAPRTAFGLIAAALLRRRRTGIAPFAVMSCDNLPGNGHATRDAVAGLTERVNPADAAWLRANVAFPNGMVDRITPATSDRERAALREAFGLDDRRPVFCEGFRQWVLEDHFPGGRPLLERVGVEFVADVTPFETMKIRILNGGHAAIAYPAALLGIELVHEAMQDAQIARFLSLLLDREIAPLLAPPPNADHGAYARRIEARFANPKIGDTIRRLCFDGIHRQPKFILPSVRDALARGRAIEGLALVSAFWCRYCFGETAAGEPIATDDPAWPRLVAQARRARARPQAWLEMTDVYGDLAAAPRFRDAFAAALAAIWRDGTRAALARYIGGWNGSP